MKPQMIFAIHGIVDAKLQIKPQKSSPMDDENRKFERWLDEFTLMRRVIYVLL
jgi:hypothetical protein